MQQYVPWLGCRCGDNDMDMDMTLYCHVTLHNKGIVVVVSSSSNAMAFIQYWIYMPYLRLYYKKNQFSVKKTENKKLYRTPIFNLCNITSLIFTGIRLTHHYLFIRELPTAHACVWLAVDKLCTTSQLECCDRKRKPNPYTLSTLVRKILLGPTYSLWGQEKGLQLEVYTYRSSESRDR